MAAVLAVLAALGGTARGDFIPEFREPESRPPPPPFGRDEWGRTPAEEEARWRPPPPPPPPSAAEIRARQQEAARQASDLRTSEYRSYATSLLDSSPQPVFSVETAEGVTGYHTRQINGAVHAEAVEHGWASERGTATEAQFDEIYQDATGKPSGSPEARGAWDEVCAYSRCDHPWADISGATPEATEERISEWFADKSSADQPGPAVAVRAEASVDVPIESLGGELERSAFADEFRSTLADLLDVSEGRIEIDAIDPGSVVVRFTVHPEGFPADQQNNRSLILRRALATSPARAAALALGRLASEPTTGGSGGVSSGGIKGITPMQLSCSHLNATAWPGGLGANLSGSWSDAFRCPSNHLLRLGAVCTPPCDKEVCCMCHADTAGPGCEYSRAYTCNGHGDPTYSGACTCDNSTRAGRRCEYSRAGTCHGHGDPTASGGCACDAGYDACEYSREVTCDGHGDPTTTGGCTCDDGYTGLRCQYSREVTCNGHGEPTATGGCTCDDHYENGSIEDLYGNDGVKLCGQRMSREKTCNGHGDPTGASIIDDKGASLGVCDCDFNFAIPGAPWLDDDGVNGWASPNCDWGDLEYDGYFNTSWWKIQLAVACCLGCATALQLGDGLDEDGGACVCFTVVFFFVWPPVLAVVISVFAAAILASLLYGLASLLYGVYRCCEAAGRAASPAGRATSRLKAAALTDEFLVNDIPMQPITSRKPAGGLNQNLLGGGDGGDSGAAAR